MTNAFRLGFSTLSQEVTLDQLPVQGHIPSWLAGTLLRNGPGQFEVGEQRYRHWFDGLGMLHRFSFHQGRVSYANRFLQSELYRKTMESGKISYRQFATDPCRMAFQEVSTLYTPSNNANVNIAYLNEQFVAMTETPLPIAFDPQTLDTLGVVSYQDDLEGRNATAHPHYDARTQATINALVQFGQQSHYPTSTLFCREHSSAA